MTSPSPLAQALSRYGRYHRDRRNVATHALGIPLIVLAMELLLSRPAWAFAHFAFTPAVIASVAATFYYLKLDRMLGAVLGLSLLLAAKAGMEVAQAIDTPTWLAASAGLFAVGWAFQFLGHYYEGRKPAFVDDMRSLLIGPLFVLVELVLALGLRADLKPAMQGDPAPAPAPER